MHAVGASGHIHVDMMPQLPWFHAHANRLCKVLFVKCDPDGPESNPCTQARPMPSCIWHGHLVQAATCSGWVAVW